LHRTKKEMEIYPAYAVNELDDENVSIIAYVPVLNNSKSFNILIACCLTNQEFETRLILWYKTLLAL
jgi:hypothetical protein